MREYEAIISKECISIDKAPTCSLNSYFHKACFMLIRFVIPIVFMLSVPSTASTDCSIIIVSINIGGLWFSQWFGGLAIFESANITENLFTTKGFPSIQVFLPHTCELIISLLIYRGTQTYNQECCNDTGQDMLWHARDNTGYELDVHQVQVLWVVTLSGRVVDFQSFEDEGSTAF